MQEKIKRIRKVYERSGVLVISLRSVDKRELNIEAGDEVDISDIEIIKQKKRKSK